MGAFSLLGFGRWVAKAAKAALAWAWQHPWQVAVAVLLVVALVTRGDLKEARADIVARTAERDQANANHRKTKANYRQAQAQAAEFDRRRLVRVKAEQEEITDEVVANYARRLADARARAEQLREQSRAGIDPGGAADRERVPGAVPPAGRADGATADTRLPLAVARDRPRAQLERDLIATEQAVQLDELITLIERQSKVQVNTPAPVAP